jgi:hypothetical protein
MTRAFAIALALLCAACSSLGERHVGALMDRIEQQVQLPKSANALSAYARYYAYTPSGDIEALYILPLDLSCEELDVCLKSINGPKAGERRWVEDVERFGAQFDGGCSVIRLTFDPVTARTKTLRCNGVV